MNLTPDEGEASAELEQELSDVLNERRFDLLLVRLGRRVKESQSDTGPFQLSRARSDCGLGRCSQPKLVSA